MEIPDQDGLRALRCGAQIGQGIGKELFAMLQELVCQSLMPDVVSYNAATCACQKSKQWEGALGLLQEVVHQLLTPNMSFKAWV